MEYFLPLSVMAMIISSISIFLIDYQNPTSNTDPENDPSSSNPSEKIDEDSVDEFTVAVEFYTKIKVNYESIVAN